MKKQWTIEYCGDEEIYVTSLDKKVRAKVYNRLRLLEALGPSLPEPQAKELDKATGLHELRTEGRNPQRLYYICVKSIIYIFDHGTKQQQQQDIDRAKKRAKQLLREVSREVP